MKNYNENKKEKLIERTKDIEKASPLDIEALLNTDIELTDKEKDLLIKRFTSSKKASKYLFSLDFPPRLYEELTGDTQREKEIAYKQRMRKEYLLKENKNRLKDPLSHFP